MLYTLLTCCLFLIIQGCAIQKPYLESSMSVEESKCLAWLENIEGMLEKYDMADPETHRLIGFPHLKSNRFLASMADLATTNEAYAEWIEQLRQLDSTAKNVQIANLPNPARQQLATKKPASGSLNQALDYCGKRLNMFSETKTDHKINLLEQSQVPDTYQMWKRIIGLYPLARYVSAIAIERLHRELNTSFTIPVEKLPQQGQFINYSPQQNGLLAPEKISAMLRSAYDNPLGIPRLAPEQLQQLLTHFAPVWEIDTRNNGDKIGAVHLGSDNQPRVDINQPTVYVKNSYARWRGKVLLQLIYQIWLPAREKTGLLDLYGGPLDSVIWRVTLSPQGKPIAFDSIHGCGCYYLLFPGEGYRAVLPKDGAEPVLSPKPIAAIPPGHRLLLRLQSRTHYLQQVSLGDEYSGTIMRRYLFQDLDQLRSLPMPNGERRSLFGKDGIIDASERSERFLLWPFGIASPGAMRQWGTHAIAFIGKRHFDDPFLLENLIGKE